MTLFVHHGPHLGALAGELAEHLAEPTGDPFEPIVVAVPTAGVRDWLGRQLAARLGVTANIRMPFPGRFLAAALGTPLDADDPWQVDRLTWAVLDVLESGVVDVPGWSRATRPSQSRRYAVARRLADLFDRYATTRPQVLQQWHNGAIGDGTVRVVGVGGAADDEGDGLLVGGLDPTMVWQFHLWRAVRAHVGTASPAERLPELVGQLRAGVVEPALPSTVAMFGIGTIAPAQLDVVTALAAVRDVRLSIIHPSAVLWHRTAPAAPGRLVARRRFDEAATAAADGHPLLRSWGRLGVETAALLRGASDTVVVGITAVGATVDDAPAPTLLAHIQRDIQLDRSPTVRAMSSSDTSVQVHACHGVTRQLEVLRDVLGHLFVANPDLQPRDVLVVCPDLSRFEPFAKAVFARGSMAVPLAISDLSLGTDNPVAAALATIVRTVADRCTRVDVLAVAALEPVRQRLGIDTDDLARFATWTDRLGTSWGLDGHHRGDWLDIDIASGTWEISLHSLLLGAAMPAPEPRAAFGGTVPYDDISTDDLAAAGRLAEMIARLRRTRDLFTASRPIAAWCDVLVEVLGLLAASEAADAWQMAEVLAAIDGLRTESEVGGAASRVALDRTDVSALVDHLVAGSPGRLSLRSGRVTMTGLVPVRNVPARVVCLLGFDEASLRPPGIDGDDVLSLRPCIGERDRRAEQRQLVLDALMAAESHLVVVCDGNDITTNRRMRFPVQLAELLEVVDATTGDAADRKSGVVVHNPLRAFDERNFISGEVSAVRDGVFGFDDTMRAAAESRRTALDSGAAPTPLRWSIAAPVPLAVNLAQLTEACTRPARTLLRDGLDVRLPPEVVRQDSNIPLGVSALDSASLGQRLLDRYRTAAADPSLAAGSWEAIADAGVAEWARAEALRSGNPPGKLIDQSLDTVRRDVDLLVAAAALCDLGISAADVIGASGAVDIDMVLRCTGRAIGSAGETRTLARSTDLRLVDTVTGVAGSTICRLNYRRPKSRVLVGAALDLAAAVVASGRSDWQALTVTRGASGTTAPACHILRVGAGEPVVAATSLLETAAELRFAALQGAVPLFEESSKDLHKSGFIDEEMLLGNGFMPGDMGDPDTQFVWGSVTTAEMLRLTPSPLTLARMMWGAVHWFASITKVELPKATKSKATRR